MTALPIDEQDFARDRGHIDMEIDTLLESVRALKTRRNTLLPICRLPPEILSAIFGFVFAGFDRKNFNIAWIESTSHVCQHWRNVALACPSLWVHIFPAEPIWMDELLKRSKMAPLVVRISYNSPVSTKAFEALRNHITRLRELHVGIDSIRELFAATGSVSVPFLQTLCLKNTSSTFILDESYIRPDTFDGTSRLRRLKLTRCNLLWDSPLLSGLTHLKIHELQTSLPTTSQLLDALDRMPNLEILDLKDCLPVILEQSDSPSVAPASRVVNLSRLSLLRLRSWFLECANVQNHISHPSNTILSLTYKISDMTETNISCLVPILSKVRESTEGGLQKPIIFLHIENNVRDIRLRAATHGIGLRPGYLLVPSDPHIDIELELLYHFNSDRARARGISRFCRALPLTPLTTLYININLDVTEWLTVFGCLAGLSAVHVCGSTACGIIAALMQPVDESPPATSGVDGPSCKSEAVTSAGAFFPGLRILVLESTYFSDEGLDLDDLRTCLVQRSSTRSELGIRELRLLHSYHLKFEDVDSIQGLVPHFEWDCVDQELASSDSGDSFRTHWYDDWS